jgi:hypothetical protein
VSKSLWIVLLASFVMIFARSGSAHTPDGQTPAQETVCDNEQGAAFGLCNAYCEAMDCTDPNQHASDQGCAAVKRNFEKKTGRPLPCEVQCPCANMLQLFADIESGAVHVDRCIITPTQLFVVIDNGDFALISDSPTASCSVNAQAPFVDLTPTELLVCRVGLRKAVEAQGVTCEIPE